MLFSRIRESRVSRVLSFFLAINILAEIVSPNVALALTTGPSQPEVQSFEPINTSEMVDVFSGDFKYNIPLMDVGGYPLNIAYNSGVGMDEEASWVGLGWNLNVGAITRNMRGLPDDFNGEDRITKEFSMKPNNTYGAGIKGGGEMFGFDVTKTETIGGATSTSTLTSLNGSLNIGLSVHYNNYTGIGVEQSISSGLQAGIPGKGTLNANMGITSSASDGLNVTHSVSYSMKIDNYSDQKTNYSLSGGAGVAMGYNSRSGLKNFSLTSSMTQTSSSKTKEGKSTSTEGTAAGTVHFGASTYVTNIQFPMKNISIAANVKWGSSLFGADGTMDLSGFFSSQRLATNSLSLPAYGYLYSHNGQGNDDALMDFNREKDGGFSSTSQYLPLTNHTYDVFSVAGQGIGGAYRPFRSDIGYVRDNASRTTNVSTSLGAEIGVGNVVHSGVDVSVVDVNTKTGMWYNNNEAAFKTRFKSYNVNDPLFESAYFKEVGEKSVDSDPAFFNAVGAFDPVRIQLQGAAMMGRAGQTYEKQSSATSGFTNLGMPTDNMRDQRQKRNQVITTMTLAEAKNFGLDKTIYNAGGQISAAAKSHHIAEISVLRPDGSRYVYGLPAYNTTQEEVTFNVSGQAATTVKDMAYGLVPYNHGIDNAMGNSRGIDNYYNKVTTPAYAHAYMLTGVVSPDYVDVTGDGLTDDDLGNYTKFSYTAIKDYEWRTPVGSGKANYNENTKSAGYGDDQANYVYGKKDVFYVTQIETKNYIAIFDSDYRRDGFEVKSNGSLGTRTTYYLKKITLYSKPEYAANGPDAVPIKTVNFVYDYSLCTKPGLASADSVNDVPNNGLYAAAINNPDGTTSSNAGGKLTLKKVFFTYGSSLRAKLNTYEFTYNKHDANGNELNNYPYDAKAYDRWGNYKPNPVSPSINPSATSTANQLKGPGKLLPNWEFPYVPQGDTASANLYASAWCLTQIKLPSGGTINVDYEADDYAYVQNMPAMDMFKVTNIASGPAATPAAVIPTGDNNPVANLMDPSVMGNGNNLYLYFKLKEQISASSAGQYFRDNYLKDLQAGRFMYFRFLVNMTHSGIPGNQNLGDYYEYVSGYAEIDASSSGTLASGNSTPGMNDYGYVKLKSVDISSSSSNQVNPIAKAAWQMGRMQYSNLVWDANFTPSGDAISVIKAFANSGILKNMAATLNGPNKTIRDKDYGKQAVLNKSWIRLYDPNGKKVGGGVRVRTLTIGDNWNGMTQGQDSFTYGQKYEYTMTQGRQTISSGVAAYEPMAGNDENPFHLPNRYTNQTKNPLSGSFLMPTENLYSEEPYGESFFPAASVGYSQVKVYNLKHANVNTHATGYVIHKFYTAKDYPTITRHTEMAKKPFKPPFAGLLKIAARDYMTTSQGYVIELNDMHGKQRGMEVYAEGKTTPITKIEYYYKTEGGAYKEPTTGDITMDASLSANHLDNVCAVVRPDGSLSSAVIGVDYDMINDFRESKTTTVTGGLQLNLAAFVVGIFPGVAPTVWPDFSYEETRFRSAVTTKVISRYGLLESTVATDLGSKVETRDIAYDSETGEVLLNKTANDYNDGIYSFSYPAHWMYDRMGQAYKNIGVTFTNVSFSGSGLAALPNYGTTGGSYFDATKYLVTGDEISIGGTTKAWVCSVTTGGITAMNASGKLIKNVTGDVKVLRSGRRNQQAVSVGSIVSLVNPIDNNNDGTLESALNFDKVTKTGAVEYAEQWQMHGGFQQQGEPGCTCTLTTKGTALYNFMVALANAHLLQNPLTLSGGQSNLSSATVYDLGSNTYSLGFTSTLYGGPSMMPTSKTLQWYYKPTAGSNVAEFGVACDPGCFTSPVENCGHISGTLPSGLLWSNITIEHLNGSPYIVTDPSTCTGKMMANATYHLNSAPGTSLATTIEITSASDCWVIMNCGRTTGGAVTCSPFVGDTVNPYLQGLYGNWRTVRSWSYLASRSQSITNNNTDTRNDGIIQTYDHSSNALITFQPFWKIASGVWSVDNSYWTFTSQVTKYSPNGFELENKDALGRYSSALYGYNQSLPMAVAGNARLQEIAFDGFEDYDYQDASDCRRAHLNFFDDRGSRSSLQSHTGKFSMQLNQGATIKTSRPLTTATPSVTTKNACSYKLADDDLLGTFSPLTYSAKSQYVLSYWLKEIPGTNPGTPVLDYGNGAVTVNVSGQTINVSQVNKSAIIDGWQRVEYVFELPVITSAANMDVLLQNASSGSGAVTCYFDDIRIHPYQSSLKTFVYHPVTLKFVAELDANNFATFYEYDEEGTLVRVKKETERGVMTIKETRNHTSK